MFRCFVNISSTKGFMCNILGVLNEKNRLIKFSFQFLLGNEQLFKERDRKDDDYLGRLKDFRIDSLEAQGSQVIAEYVQKRGVSYMYDSICVKFSLCDV